MNGFKLLTAERALVKQFKNQCERERESSLSNLSRFKAKEMPDFGSFASFIPLLSEKPLTIQKPFIFHLNERESYRKDVSL